MAGSPRPGFPDQAAEVLSATASVSATSILAVRYPMPGMVAIA